MDTKTKEKKAWLIIAAGALAISVASLFLPIISYRTSDGMVYHYNLFGLM